MERKAKRQAIRAALTERLHGRKTLNQQMAELLRLVALDGRMRQKESK